jgi:LPXTG-motif cell wall-anchored protein
MKKKNMLLIGIGAVMAAAAFFFFKKRNDKEQKPPKKALQLDIQNPGEQSEFTTAASESEIG